MIQELVIKGKTYQKGTDLAKHLGYTSDYIGQLCRAGKVESEMIGKSWYVEPNSMAEYKKGRYRSNQAKSQAAIAEYKKAATTGQTVKPQLADTLSARFHHYENDESDLIPALKKEAQAEAASSTPTPPAKKEPNDKAYQVPIKIVGNTTRTTARSKQITRSIRPQDPIKPAGRPHPGKKVAWGARPAVAQPQIIIKQRQTSSPIRSSSTASVLGSTIKLVGVAMMLLSVAGAGLLLRMNYVFDGQTTVQRLSLDTTPISEITSKYIVISDTN